ncbi:MULTISPECIES: ABC transporter substrate-binding protein [unclassified Afipia]|uniref:ABC transporter substrate-binding protein n=1 Tax=unclassified Afipia TaxID=2642050 RepID=UPI000467815A|nr:MULTISPECIES: ABC transporter substrate-binding protein [unclassified Afipia]MAH71444.1 branched-chain amino acid ABC transporter substrate-binding protein [Afipia sp.]OUX59294.1 MAG: branched-chain amino acid ABC transporter substrate-binding protein [Afipia sp. TMED4]HAP10648.1 branched-chain amino acid ABC transporter substrate-binding protein [Afipia sp.]HBF52422.1 branched-chain amino acid ABC transporter substrate-binding protein [Afipia sp.]HCX16877.1 branched-chain amino acid ABC tr
MSRILFAALAASLTLTTAAVAADAPGVTATEIKVGATFPFSGPASALGNAGKGLIAYVNQINDRGGINGRKINLITYDDAYSPPKAVEHTRKLIESDEVAFMFGQLGTPSNSATNKYLTGKKIPSAFITTGATKFTDSKEYPLTTTSLPSYDTEGKVYAKYFRAELPNAKVGILYQNDDFGKDFLNAMKVSYKDEAATKLVAIPYEVADPTVDSQVVNLKASAPDAFLFAGTPKFAAQALRKMNEMGWKPLTVVNFVGASIGATFVPVGLDKVVGVVTAGFQKEPTDPKWKDDQGVKDFIAFAQKYLPGADLADQNYMFGYQQGMILEQLIKQSGNDLSRENILKQSKSIKDLTLPTALPGIKVNTSETVNQAYTQLQLQKWNGKSWDQFGSVLKAD